MTKPVHARLGVCSCCLHPHSPADLIAGLKKLNVQLAQVVLAPWRESAKQWAGTVSRLRDEGIRCDSGIMGTTGEDYSSLASIKKTGGFVPDQHWDTNWRIVQEIADIATREQLKTINFHAGFIPHDPQDPLFGRLCERIAQVADHFAQAGLDVLLETGQEPADVMRKFVQAVGKDNVGINFDPANMILYSTGEPMQALQILLPWVKQVHLKDALPPDTPDTPGTWGTEVALGDGVVDWQAFMAALHQAGFAGDLIIEREAGEDRSDDVQQAIRCISPML